MDLLNLAGDERLDLGDLTFATNDVPTGLVNELTGNFLVAPGATAIVTGLRPSGSGQGPVQVGDSGTPNVAFLGQRLNGVVTQGVLTLAGPASQQVAVASLPANTYGIFVRFNRLPGQSQTRKFWAKAAPGQEYSQLHSTRLVATWEARVEVSAPSAEWVKIGQVVVTSAGSGQGSTITVTDQRLLYFEGPASGGYAPAWGSAADRSTDRSAANTGNLQRQLDALRQCIVDIKGRGLATWYQPNISGLQVGSGFTLANSPLANCVAVGDDKFNLYLQTNVPGAGTIPGIGFDGGNDYIGLNRGTGGLFRNRANVQIFGQDSTGLTQLGTPSGLAPGMLSVWPGGQASLYGAAVQTTSSTVPATLGLVSKQAGKAFVEFGQNGYNNSYGIIQCQWTQTPTLTFGVSSLPFLTASAAANGNANTLVVNFSGAVNSDAPISVANRPACRGGTVFAAGYVSVGNFSPSTVSVPQGCTVSASNGNMTLTFSGVSLPSLAAIIVTPMRVPDNQGYTATARQNGNTISVIIRDSSNNLSTGVDYSIVVYWAGS